VRLGQSLADDVRRLPLRDRRGPIGQDLGQRRKLEPHRLPAYRGQAGRGGDRGARPLVRRLRRERGDRPTSATGRRAATDGG
jgi:hypothetical protein